MTGALHAAMLVLARQHGHRLKWMEGYFSHLLIVWSKNDPAIPPALWSMHDAYGDALFCGPAG